MPDIAVYRWERIPRTPAGKLADDFIEPPDIVVEIVSPEQSVNALVRRCLWYVDHGVRAALLVDPQDESVLLFRADGRPRVLRQADQIGLSDEIPGFQLTVQALFSVLNVE